MRRKILRLVFATSAVTFALACGPRPVGRPKVDLAEVRGFGNPVVLYDVEKAEAVADLVREAVARASVVEEVPDGSVQAGEHPYVRVSYFSDVKSGRYEWGRALVVFRHENKGSILYFRPLDAERWQRASLPADVAEPLAREAEKISGAAVHRAAGVDADAIRAVRRALTEVAVTEGLFDEDLKVRSIEPRTFSDASLGCPFPGEAYAQVLTPGYLVRIDGLKGSWDVRVAGDDARICP